MKCHPLLLVPIAASLLCSCATYVTPGAQANLSLFTDPKVKKAYAAKPGITFPADIALVRIQEAGYRSASAQGVGTGAYSVVTTRDLETDRDFDAFSKIPGIAGVVTLSKLLLPGTFSSDVELREAAAKLHADAVLVYTVDTEFHDNDVIPPLTTISLGLAPNKKYKITSTASAILMDTKTGYIYGALEEGDTRNGFTMAWGSDSAIDAARRKAERAAFEKLLASFEPFWKRVYARYKH